MLNLEIIYLKYIHTWQKVKSWQTNNTCLISGFRHEVVLDSWPLKMGPIGCPIMLGRSYHYLLYNNVEGVFQTKMPWQAENLVGYITENSYMIWNSTLWLDMRPSLSFLVQWLYTLITPQNSYNSWKLYNSQSTAQNCWTKYNFIVRTVKLLYQKHV